MTATNKLLACGKDFYESVSKLPNSIKGRLVDLYGKLTTSVDNNGLNFESLRMASDSTFRSVRLDDTYRLILSQQANSYILLWVDHHDRAYEWANKRRLDINTSSKMLELVEIRNTQEEASENNKQWTFPNTKEEEDSEPLFSKFTDADLRDILNLDDTILAQLRTYRGEDQFLADQEELEKKLGIKGFEILFDLACGMNYEEVKSNYLLDAKNNDISTVDEALTNAYSSMNFHVITTEEELQMALSWPLDRWRIFLHPSQKALVNKNHNGPFRVTGGAGTGKTVAAMHRAAWLAEQLEQEGTNGKVLFTTFTKNLASDIKNNLRKICTAEQLERIEVVNLDAWAMRLLQTAGCPVIPIWSLNKAEQAKIWEDALATRSGGGLPEAMTEEEIRREWEQVVQDHDVTTLAEYLRVARTGRGIRLSKEQKKELWNVFDEYRSTLKQRNLSEADDIYRAARELIEHDPSLVKYYTSVIVDEAQDFGNTAFRLLAATVKHRPSPKNTMYITGDAHQRIYRRKVVLSRCGIDVRGRSRTLRINYRTTEETCHWASAILHGCNVDDLDGGLSNDLKGYHSLMHGEAPLICATSSEEEEVQSISDYITQLTQNGCPLHAICMVVKHNNLKEYYKAKMEAKGWSVHVLDQGSGTKEGELNLGTMHRVKGLEFDYMILAGMSDENLASESDQDSEEERLFTRSLIHVAATRARKHVLITSPAPLAAIIR